MKALVLSLFLFLPVAVSGQYQKGVVVTEQANLRAAPSIKGKILTTLHRDDTFKVIQDLNPWCRVRTKYGAGWLHRNTISLEEAPVLTSPAAARSIAGTTWSGTDSDGDYYVLTFDQDGTLAYQSPTGSYRNGKWTQSKNSVHFEMNDHFSEYSGKINGNIIQGKAWNKSGHRWRWKFSIHSEP